MTVHDDAAITSALHDLADKGVVGSAPLDQLLKRGRSARVRRAGTAGGALAGLAVAVAVTVGIAGSWNPPEHTVSLAAAANSTAATSFDIKITVPPWGDVSAENAPFWRANLVIEGAYDPVHQNGFLTQVSGANSWTPAYTQIIVGGTCYTQVPLPLAQGGGAQWQQGDADPCFDGWIIDTPAGSAANPATLLKQLAAAGSAHLVSRTGNGANEVDVWSYSYTAPSGLAVVTLAGTATVDAATQHVTKMTQQIVNTVFTRLPTPPAGAVRLSAASPTPSATSTSTSGFVITYEFSHFGVPVTVTAPSTAPAKPSN